MPRTIYQTPILPHFDWCFIIVTLKTDLLIYWWNTLVFMSDYLWGYSCFLCNLLVVGLPSWIIYSWSFSFSYPLPDVSYSTLLFPPQMINSQPSSYWHIWLFPFLATFSSFGFSHTTLSCFLLLLAPSLSLFWASIPLLHLETLGFLCSAQSSHLPPSCQMSSSVPVAINTIHA